MIVWHIATRCYSGWSLSLNYCIKLVLLPKSTASTYLFPFRPFVLQTLDSRRAKTEEAAKDLIREIVQDGQLGRTVKLHSALSSPVLLTVAASSFSSSQCKYAFVSISLH